MSARVSDAYVAEVQATSPHLTRDDIQQAMDDYFARQVNLPCPICREPNGFHDDVIHGEIVTPWELIKEKGWHKR